MEVNVLNFHKTCSASLQLEVKLLLLKVPRGIDPENERFWTVFGLKNHTCRNLSNFKSAVWGFWWNALFKLRQLHLVAASVILRSVRCCVATAMHKSDDKIRGHVKSGWHCLCFWTSRQMDGTCYFLNVSKPPWLKTDKWRWICEMFFLCHQMVMRIFARLVQDTDPPPPPQPPLTY